MNDKMTEKQAPSVYVVVQKPSHGSGSKDEEEYLSKDEEEYLAKKCPRKTMLVLACLQLSACGLAAITQVFLFAFKGIGYGNFAVDAATGLWAGMFFGIAGSLGAIVAHRPSCCSIKGLMTMSIIASIMALALIITSTIGISEARGDNENGLKTLFGFQLVGAFVEGIVAIISAAFCCGAICCRGQNSISGSVINKPQEIRSNEQGGAPKHCCCC